MGSPDPNSPGNPNSCPRCHFWRQRLMTALNSIAHRGPATHQASHRFSTTSNRPDFRNSRYPILSKIRYLLITLTLMPSEYDQLTPKIEHWIEYVLRERFATVDELVEGVSYVAWEDGGSYASLGRFLKEFHDAPHRSGQARSFVTELCSHVLRWFAIASVENLSTGRYNSTIASGGGNGFIRAASFIGHLIGCGLLSHELVRQHLIKPLIDHRDGAGGESVRTNAIYQLFIAAGNTLFQGLFEAEDIRVCFEMLDAQSTAGKIAEYDAARAEVWCIVHNKASHRSLTCGLGTSRDSP